jgi:hypothetical protein
MKIDRDLTLLYGVKFQEQLSLTYEGQAHFASTGPTGAAGPSPQTSLPQIQRHDTGAGVRAGLPPLSIETVFGWRVRSTPNSNPRFHRNFLMQGTGAEMMRIACCLGTERGIEACAPVHDAVLIAAPLEQLDEAVANTRSAMAEASTAVLSGFELGTDVKIVRYPDRYSDPRGEVMWARVMKAPRRGEGDRHRSQNQSPRNARVTGV